LFTLWGLLLKANVVCHQLGFTKALSATRGSSFGPVSAVHAYDNVRSRII
jgi:hypothetical protein